MGKGQCHCQVEVENLCAHVHALYEKNISQN